MADEKNNNHNTSIILNEQFWFTAAVVGFNTAIVESKLLVEAPIPIATASCIVSLFGVHLIMSRWTAQSGRRMSSDWPSTRDSRTESFCDRLDFTICEIGDEFRNLPYVFAEASGSLFYLTLMIISCLGAVYASWPK